MRVAYVRVSTIEQNESRQIEALKCHDIEKWYIEKASAKTANRPKLQEMLDFVREGDIVVVSDFSRLAKSTRDMLQIFQELTDKGVGLISMKENLDTDTPQGKFMLTVFAALAELERATILQRQREGIEIAKAQGKYKGRKPLPVDENRFRAECSKWRAGEQTAMDTMRHLNIKPNRFYRIVKRLGV